MKRRRNKLPARKLGHTKWFPRETRPVHHGDYECIVRITNAGPGSVWPTKLRWDGRGFIVPFPMMVDYWRGLTAAGLKLAKAQPAP